MKKINQQNLVARILVIWICFVATPFLNDAAAQQFIPMNSHGQSYPLGVDGIQHGMDSLNTSSFDASYGVVPRTRQLPGANLAPAPGSASFPTIISQPRPHLQPKPGLFDIDTNSNWLESLSPEANPAWEAYQSVIPFSEPATNPHPVLHRRERKLGGLFDSEWTRSFSVFGGFDLFAESTKDLFEGTANVSRGSTLGLEIGRRHSSIFRSTFELANRNSDVNSISTAFTNYSGDVNVLSVMKNFYFERPNWGRSFTPYLGFGLGFAHVDGDIQSGGHSISGNFDAFAYQLMLGASRKVNPRLAMFAEYRIFGTGDVTFVNNGPDYLAGFYFSHNFLFGLRFGY